MLHSQQKAKPGWRPGLTDHKLVFFMLLRLRDGVQGVPWDRRQKTNLKPSSSEE